MSAHGGHHAALSPVDILKKLPTYLWIGSKMLFFILRGIFEFLLGYPEIAIVFGVFMSLLTVYLFGKYLTLLPASIVFILVIASLKYKNPVMIFLRISAFASLFWLIHI